MLIRPWGIKQDSANQKHLCPSFGPLWKSKQQYLGKRKKKHIKILRDMMCPGLIAGKIGNC